MQLTSLYAGNSCVSKEAHMPSDKLRVAVTRRLPEAVETRMKELFDVHLRDQDTPMERAELGALMKTIDVLVPTVTDDIDAALLAQAGPDLKLIANFGAGVDHIDVKTANQRGILVSNTSGVVTEDTADMAMALMLGVTRRIPEGLSMMQSGQWSGWSPTGFWGALGRPPPGYPWDGPHWSSGCAARARLWRSNSLSQSQTPAFRN